jgi:ribosomal protein S27E
MKSRGVSPGPEASAGASRLRKCEVCGRRIAWTPGVGGPPKRCRRHRHCRNSHGVRGDPRTAPARSVRCRKCGGPLVVALNADTRLVESCAGCGTSTLLIARPATTAPRTTSDL